VPQDEGAMSDADDAKKRGLVTYEGPAHSAPYPMSRMGSPYQLVDVAAEIQRADESLAQATGGKLLVIAEQIRSLQTKARELLDRAHRDAELHRAKCNFEKRAGGVYHLYRDERGQLWFSLIAPDEWVTKHKNAFVASYRLESDMSFTPLGEVDARAAEHAQLARLLEGKG
jgi:hypothetical protein